MFKKHAKQPNGKSPDAKLTAKEQKKLAKQQAKSDKKNAKLAKKNGKKGNAKKKSESKSNGIEQRGERIAEKEHVFGDVRLFRLMPMFAMLGALLLIVGFGWLAWGKHQYNVAQSRISMSDGTKLPMFRGESKGKLTLTHKLLSKDGKQMAISISYDDEAHSDLSSFGKNYGIWVIGPNGYPMKDISTKYGFFGTDGNAVLQINSKVPFPDQAIAIVIVDKAKLVNASNLATATTTTTEDDITTSITAQLSNGTTNNTTSSSSSSGADSTNNTAMYYVRINPYRTKHASFNWGNNEKKLVQELFVKNNLKDLKKQLQQNNAQLKQAKKTLKEYNDRLAINSQDATALSGKQDIESTITQLEQSNEKANNNYDKLVNTKLGSDILGKQQTSHEALTTSNMQYFTNSGVQQ